MNKADLTLLIKEQALALGFSSAGIAKAESVDEETQDRFNVWLEGEYNGDMIYMANNKDKRLDPTLLVEGAKSVIVVALNYYPQVLQRPDVPQFSYYAYGKDYHDVIKSKLRNLSLYIESLGFSVSGRSFTDSAPILERYWAVKAGLGFIGKSNMLILPKSGTFFFLGVLIVDLELEYDSPLELSCGKCRKCLDVCPTGAFVKPYMLDARKCVSYLTIEYRGDLPSDVQGLFGQRVYGCDSCQLVCPWNRFANPTLVNEFTPIPEFLGLDAKGLDVMTEEDFRRIFKGSAVKRTKYQGLMRNSDFIKE